VRLDEVAAAAAAGRERVYVAGAAAVTVTGEPDALRRAVDNVLDNAEIHGPREGEITMEVRIEDGEALLSVRDEGAGLEAEEATHAFDRFWRGRDAQGKPGSGLGLALVLATAQRHGGRVAIDGSTVTIVLPGAIPATTATRLPGGR
jgi:signal transduction histidine kinase